MPERRGAGRFQHRVAFDKRAIVGDGYGNEIAGDWLEQFQQMAEFKPVRGSETVMAGRLESRESMIMNVRVSSDTRRIGTDWQARDVRRGTAFNIRIITDAVDRASLDLLVEQNVATG